MNAVKEIKMKFIFFKIKIFLVVKISMHFK